MKFSEINEVRLEKPDGVRQEDIQKYIEWNRGINKTINRLSHGVNWGIYDDSVVKALKSLNSQEYSAIRSEVAELSSIIREAKNLDKKSRDLALKIIEKIKSSKKPD